MQHHRRVLEPFVQESSDCKSVFGANFQAGRFPSRLLGTRERKPRTAKERALVLFPSSTSPRTAPEANIARSTASPGSKDWTFDVAYCNASNVTRLSRRGECVAATPVSNQSRFDHWLSARENETRHLVMLRHLAFCMVRVAMNESLRQLTSTRTRHDMIDDCCSKSTSFR